MVEFEYTYSEGTFTAIGLIYSVRDTLKIWHNGERRIYCGSVSDSGKKDFRKVGSSEISSCTISTEAERIARAYFSNLKTKPQFKVGDRVRIARKPEEGEDPGDHWFGPNAEQYIGEVTTIVIANDTFVEVECSGYDFPLCCLEPA